MANNARSDIISPKKQYKDDNTTFKGWSGLNKILSFLDRATYISTTIFKRLRLVIEYKND